MMESKMTESKMKKAYLMKANMTGADIRGANFQMIKFNTLNQTSNLNSNEGEQAIFDNDKAHPKTNFILNH